MLKKTLVTLSAWALVGCASLDLSQNTTFEVKPDETMVLVAARVRNTREPKYPFEDFNITFERSRMMYAISGPATEAAKATVGAGDDRVFLVAARVKAGHNEMTRFTGHTARTPVFSVGKLGFGVSAPFTALPGQVQYLGFLEIENIDRQHDNQQSTGPVIPLLEQFMTGIAKGTLAIRLSDRSQQDIERFRQAFPALSGHDIQSAPLQKIALRSAVAQPALSPEPTSEPEVVVLERAAAQQPALDTVK